MCLNAYQADKLKTARKIELTGKVTGSASFDGSQDIKIAVDTTAIEDTISALPNGASDGIKIENNIIKHTNAVTAGTASEGGSSRTLAFGGTFKVPSVTYDAQGHIKSKSSVTLTMPANPNTTYTLAGELDGNEYDVILNPSTGTGTEATIPSMGAATSSTAGTAGLVPAPQANA